MTGLVALPDGCTGRAATPDHLAGVERLLAACDAVERESGYGSLLGQIRAVISDHAPRAAGAALVVTDAAGGVVACASLNLPDYPRPVAIARLHGAVHPEHRRRGIGRFLLDWSERQAQSFFDARAESRPRSLRVTFSGSRDDAERLYARFGCVLHERTLQLRRRLDTPVERRPLPLDFSAAPWSSQTAPLFFAAFRAAHTPTPEERIPTEAEWCADVAGDTTLRPDLSLVALDSANGGRPCALILSEVVPRDGQPVGWIWRLAVAPSDRRRGLATSLMTHALAAFRREGLPEAGLWVDEANAPARALYDRLGFRHYSRQTTYAKPLRGADG